MLLGEGNHRLVGLLLQLSASVSVSFTSFSSFGTLILLRADLLHMAFTLADLTNSIWVRPAPVRSVAVLAAVDARVLLESVDGTATSLGLRSDGV